MRIMECSSGRSCPYLRGRDIWGLLRERDYLRERISHMEGVMGLAEAKIRELSEENKRLKEENNNLLHRIKKAVRKIFKPNISRDENEEGPKRGAPKGHPGRGRIRPIEITEVVDIYPRTCACGSSDISGYENSFDEHVVEDIEVRPTESDPPLVEKKVTCFRMHYGRCRSCGRVISPQRDNSIIPRSRIGPMARSVSSHLHYLGIPYRKVRKIFKEVFHLDMSHPSLMHFDTKQAENGALLFEGIKELVRSSSYVNIDETGWREDGRNCWLWVFVTDEAVLYVIDDSRGSKVVEGILGERYGGILGIDFYSAYNPIKALGKQRCLSHLLDEIKNIEEKNQFPLDNIDGRFCSELKAVLKEAIEDWNGYRKGIVSGGRLAEERERIISRMIELIQIPLESPDTQRIRERIIRHNEELFLFLDHPEIEPTNNRAERQLRPNVIMRKITFGNRSEHGAEKHQIIMSIIQTGILNGIEPLSLFLALTRGDVSSFEKSIPIRGP
jgi:hypothetical protein